jgi:hypothetical protein
LRKQLHVGNICAEWLLFVFPLSIAGMAISTFLIFGRRLDKAGTVFWFMMQIAMCCGFITSYPVNWWLIRKGVKEPM